MILDPVMNNVADYRLYIRCFLYNSIRLLCYMNCNHLKRDISRSVIPIIILNIFKRKRRRRSASSFLLKCFDFFVFLLLLREDKEDEEEEEDE